MPSPELLAQVVSRAATVRVRNVLNPLLWLSAVTLPCGIGGAWLLRDHLLLAAPLVTTGTVVPLGAVIAYFYFALRDPDRLQSEEFLIEQHRLLLQQKGMRSQSPIDPASIGDRPSMTTMGAMPQIEDGSGET